MKLQGLMSREEPNEKPSIGSSRAALLSVVGALILARLSLPAEPVNTFLAVGASVAPVMLSGYASVPTISVSLREVY